MNDKTPKSPAQQQLLAERAGQYMYDHDEASKKLGISLDHIAPGHARMSMRVREDMLNGHKICHGGFIFALADSTFAFSCNSYNQITLAAAATIDFLSPARLDELLSAEGRESSLSGKNGIYDIRVSNQDDMTIALFRGRSRRISGTVIPETSKESKDS
jgi:acyl-CoA thioesterase